MENFSNNLAVPSNQPDTEGEVYLNSNNQIDAFSSLSNLQNFGVRNQQNNHTTESNMMSNNSHNLVGLNVHNLNVMSGSSSV